MMLPDFLHQGPLGEIRFVGSRIDLYFVVSAHVEGLSAEMIAERYPTLPLAVIRKAVAFYLENRAVVDEYVRGVNAEYDQLMATTPHVDLARLRERAARAAAAARPTAGE
jgi:uncharacterized protein (DUF433 family)